MLKHYPITEWPDITKIKDLATIKAFEELGRILQPALRHIYDDIKTLQTADVYGATLPAAAVAYRGRFFLKTNAGAEDTLHICLYNASGGTYSWKAVTTT